MNINYKRLFNLIIGHDYFKDGYDRFVHLKPTLETKRLLKNGKMLFKPLPHGVTVLYRATEDEVTPFVELEKDQHFTFVMTAENITGLMNITNLDESATKIFKSSSVLYFKNNPANATSNTGNPEIITHELLDSVKGQLFTYSFSILGNPSSVLFRVANYKGDLVSIGKNTDGTPFPTTITLNIHSENSFSQQVDLRNLLKGKYTITILNTAETSILKEEVIYTDDALAKQNILGIVDIIYETSTNHMYGSTEEYIIQFRRADTTWRYFVVNKSDKINFDIDSLLITDDGILNGTPYITDQFNRSFAGILITADASGSAGNSITMAYSGGGDFPALNLSGQTLTGGANGIAASGHITLVNNSVSGYTISINGFDFTEGSQFSNGATPADTANALIAAINANGSVNVTAAVTGYDLMINNMPSVVYNSAQPISFFEKPKTDIKLRMASDNQVIVANLPNPAHNGNRKSFAGNPESEIYVFI